MQCFKNDVGNPPLQYLATVHLQKAIDLLAETTDTAGGCIAGGRLKGRVQFFEGVHEGDGDAA